MNTYYISDEIFKNSKTYQDFLKANPSTGNLRIRASAANQAIPISNLNIEVSKIIDGNKVIFFEGVTDSSGVIERITLPTVKISANDEEVPSTTTYTIYAKYKDITQIYNINMYEGICVVQDINIVPEMKGGA